MTGKQTDRRRTKWSLSGTLLRWRQPQKQNIFIYYEHKTRLKVLEYLHIRAEGHGSEFKNVPWGPNSNSVYGKRRRRELSDFPKVVIHYGPSFLVPETRKFHRKRVSYFFCLVPRVAVWHCRVAVWYRLSGTPFCPFTSVIMTSQRKA